MVLVAAALKHQGIRIHPYLDDWLIWAKSHQEARSGQLGWVVNKAKSHPQLMQALEFLGAPHL